MLVLTLSLANSFLPADLSKLHYSETFLINISFLPQSH